MSGTAGDRAEAARLAEQLREKMFGGAAVRESHGVVLALMKSDEIESAVSWLRATRGRDPGVRIEDSGVYYRIDADGSLTFDLDEIEDLIGRPYSVYDFLVNVSTTIGRAYVDGNRFTITSELMGWERELPR